jgi:hypothetical protein
MRKCVLTICLGLLTLQAAAQDYPSPPAQQTSAIYGGRYEILQSPLVAKWTFRLDKYAGRVWQLVHTKDDDSKWEEMPVYDPVAVPTPNRPRFQMFTSGLAARHTFLIDTDSGRTWLLVTGKRRDKDGVEYEVVGWQRFAE